MPLIERATLSAAIDILFLRRDMPGNLVHSGGDIDNRLKTLFDALRIPTDKSQIERFPVAEGEDPFFVLLEDDSQISSINVTTDMIPA